MDYLKRPKRVLAGLVAAAFFVTNTLTPAPVSAASSIEPLSPFAVQQPIQIPEQWGAITEMIRSPNSSRLFVHIQEAHANYDAQRNIKNILEYLSKHYGLELILLEGAGNKLKPELFRFFPKNVRLNQAITNDLMKRGELTGAEVFLIDQANSKAEGWGIEDPGAYLEDREAFKEVYAHRKKLDVFSEDLYLSWKKAAVKSLNKTLREFLESYIDFEENRLSFNDWLELLKGRSLQDLKLDLSDAQAQDLWPILVRYFRLKAISPKIQKEAAQKEQEAFWADLKNRQIPEDLLSQIQKILNHEKTKNLPAYQTRFVFEKLLDILPKDYSFESYPNFRLYLQQLILLSELEGEPLHQEMKELTRRLVETLARTEKEKQQVSLLRDIQLLQKLFRLELSRDEFEKLQARGISPEKIIQALKINPSYLSRIASLFGTAIRFYKGAIAREDFMMQKALERMQRTGKNKAVMITGGFHTEGFKQKVQEAGASYVQITPRIGEISADTHKNYITALLGQTTLQKSQIASPELLDLPFTVSLAPNDIQYVVQRFDRVRDSGHQTIASQEPAQAQELIATFDESIHQLMVSSGVTEAGERPEAKAQKSEKEFLLNVPAIAKGNWTLAEIIERSRRLIRSGGISDSTEPVRVVVHRGKETLTAEKPFLDPEKLFILPGDEVLLSYPAQAQRPESRGNVRARDEDTKTRFKKEYGMVKLLAEVAPVAFGRALVLDSVFGPKWTKPVKEQEASILRPESRFKEQFFELQIDSKNSFASLTDARIDPREYGIFVETPVLLSDKQTFNEFWRFLQWVNLTAISLRSANIVEMKINPEIDGSQETVKAVLVEETTGKYHLIDLTAKGSPTSKDGLPIYWAYLEYLKDFKGATIEDGILTIARFEGNTSHVGSTLSISISEETETQHILPAIHLGEVGAAKKENETQAIRAQIDQLDQRIQELRGQQQPSGLLFLLARARAGIAHGPEANPSLARQIESLLTQKEALEAQLKSFIRPESRDLSRFYRPGMNALVLLGVNVLMFVINGLLAFLGHWDLENPTTAQSVTFGGVYFIMMLLWAEHLGKTIDHSRAAAKKQTVISLPQKSSDISNQRPEAKRFTESDWSGIVGDVLSRWEEIRHIHNQAKAGTPYVIPEPSRAIPYHGFLYKNLFNGNGRHAQNKPEGILDPNPPAKVDRPAFMISDDSTQLISIFPIHDRNWRLIVAGDGELPWGSLLVPEQDIPLILTDQDANYDLLTFHANTGFRGYVNSFGIGGINRLHDHVFLNVPDEFERLEISWLSAADSVQIGYIKDYPGENKVLASENYENLARKMAQTSAEYMKIRTPFIVYLMPGRVVFIPINPSASLRWEIEKKHFEGYWLSSLFLLGILPYSQSILDRFEPKTWAEVIREISLPGKDQRPESRTTVAEMTRSILDVIQENVPVKEIPVQHEDYPIDPQSPGGVLLFKASAGKLYFETVQEVLSRVEKLGYFVDRLLVYDGAELKRQGITAKHYGRIYEVAQMGREALGIHEIQTIREEFKSRFGEYPNPANIYGAFEASKKLGIAPEVIAKLWEERNKGVPISDGVYADAFELPKDARIPEEYQGKKVVFLNSFAIPLVADFETPGNKTVAVIIRGIPGKAVSWNDMRTQFAGKTDPKKAAQWDQENNNHSVRGDAYLGILKVENPVTVRANVIHLSAEPDRVREIPLWAPQRPEARIRMLDMVQIALGGISGFAVSLFFNYKIWQDWSFMGIILYTLIAQYILFECPGFFLYGVGFGIAFLINGASSWNLAGLTQAVLGAGAIALALHQNAVSKSNEKIQGGEDSIGSIRPESRQVSEPLVLKFDDYSFNEGVPVSLGVQGLLQEKGIPETEFSQYHVIKIELTGSQRIPEKHRNRRYGFDPISLTQIDGDLSKMIGVKEAALFKEVVVARVVEEIKILPVSSQRQEILAPGVPAIPVVPGEKKTFAPSAEKPGKKKLVIKKSEAPAAPHYVPGQIPGRSQAPSKIAAKAQPKGLSTTAKVWLITGAIAAIGVGVAVFISKPWKKEKLSPSPKAAPAQVQNTSSNQQRPESRLPHVQGLIQDLERLETSHWPNSFSDLKIALHNGQFAQAAELAKGLETFRRAEAPLVGDVADRIRGLRPESRSKAISYEALEAELNQVIEQLAQKIQNGMIAVSYQNMREFGPRIERGQVAEGWNIGKIMKEFVTHGLRHGEGHYYQIVQQKLSENHYRLTVVPADRSVRPEAKDFELPLKLSSSLFVVALGLVFALGYWLPSLFLLKWLFPGLESHPLLTTTLAYFTGTAGLGLTVAVITIFQKWIGTDKTGKQSLPFGRRASDFKGGPTSTRPESRIKENARILFVEEQSGGQVSLAGVLRHHGFSIEAVDFLKAEEVIKEAEASGRPFSLIITNWKFFEGGFPRALAAFGHGKAPQSVAAKTILERADPARKIPVILRAFTHADAKAASHYVQSLENGSVVSVEPAALNTLTDKIERILRRPESKEYSGRMTLELPIAFAMKYVHHGAEMRLREETLEETHDPKVPFVAQYSIWIGERKVGQVKMPFLLLNGNGICTLDAEASEFIFEDSAARALRGAHNAVQFWREVFTQKPLRAKMIPFEESEYYRTWVAHHPDTVSRPEARKIQEVLLQVDQAGDPLQLVEMSNGLKAPAEVIDIVVSTLRELHSGRIFDNIALDELFLKSRDPQHRLFGQTTTYSDILKNRGLLQENGDVHPYVRNIVLAALVEKEAGVLEIVEPIRQSLRPESHRGSDFLPNGIAHYIGLHKKLRQAEWEEQNRRIAALEAAGKSVDPDLFSPSEEFGVLLRLSQGPAMDTGDLRNSDLIYDFYVRPVERIQTFQDITNQNYYKGWVRLHFDAEGRLESWQIDLNETRKRQFPWLEKFLRDELTERIGMSFKRTAGNPWPEKLTTMAVDPQWYPEEPRPESRAPMAGRRVSARELQGAIHEMAGQIVRRDGFSGLLFLWWVTGNNKGEIIAGTTAVNGQMKEPTRLGEKAQFYLDRIWKDDGNAYDLSFGEIPNSHYPAIVVTPFIRPEARNLKIRHNGNNLEPWQRALWMGMKERSSDWQKMNSIVWVFLDQFEGKREIPKTELFPAVMQKLENQKLGLSAKQKEAKVQLENEVQRLIGRLIDEKMITVQGGETPTYALIVPLAVAAIRSNNHRYIQKKLELALERNHTKEKNGAAELRDLISEYAAAGETWDQSPLESQWPFLHAVAAMDKDKQEQLLHFLKQTANQKQLGYLPLTDSVFLMLGEELLDQTEYDKYIEEWVIKFGPALTGRTLYYISPETWVLGGGLGRVGQYHTRAVNRLLAKHANLITVEPRYHFKLRVQPDGSVVEEPLDYGKLEHPVKNLQIIDEFNVTVGGKTVPTRVWQGRTEDGIEVRLIDGGPFYTRLLYKYGHNQYNSAEWEEFSEFFSRATLKFMERLEEKKQDWTVRHQREYRSAVIWLNDGQAANLAVFKRLRDEENSKNSLRDAFVWMVGHTINNRGYYDGERSPLLNYGIREHRWGRLYANPVKHQVDHSSAGMRAADGGSAVSTRHLFVIAPYDPDVRILAIPNGDDRNFSSSFFRGILKDLFGDEADPERPTPKQILAAKEEGIRRVNELFGWDLDPKAYTISYSGRFVPEKAGLQRAWVNKNLRTLVEEGANVIYFANVQSRYDDKFEELKRLAEEINAKQRGQKKSGRLIVKTGWSLHDQVKVLGISHEQVQDSDFETGASEITEADVMANGGLSTGPAWIEGNIQLIGTVLDWSIPGSGNVIIPASEALDLPRENYYASEDYLEKFKEAIRAYRENPEQFLSFGATSVRLSRVHKGELVGAQYLRTFGEALKRHDNNRKFLQKIRDAFEGKPRSSQVPQELLEYFRDLETLSPEKAAEYFGEEKLAAVMALVAFFDPESLEKIKDWNSEAYEMYHAAAFHEETRGLMQEGIIRIHDTHNSAAIMVTRSRDGSEHNDKIPAVVVDLGSSAFTRENGKSWLRVHGLSAIVENRSDVKYQVEDWTIDPGKAHLYPKVRTGEDIIQWYEVGAPVNVLGRDAEGVAQKNFHAQWLVLTKVGRPESRLGQKTTITDPALVLRYSMDALLYGYVFQNQGTSLPSPNQIEALMPRVHTGIEIRLREIQKQALMSQAFQEVEKALQDQAFLEKARELARDPHKTVGDILVLRDQAVRILAFIPQIRPEGRNVAQALGLLFKDFDQAWPSFIPKDSENQSVAKEKEEIVIRTVTPYKESKDLVRVKVSAYSNATTHELEAVYIYGSRTIDFENTAYPDYSTRIALWPGVIEIRHGYHPSTVRVSPQNLDKDYTLNFQADPERGIPEKISLDESGALVITLTEAILLEMKKVYQLEAAEPAAILEEFQDRFSMEGIRFAFGQPVLKEVKTPAPATVPQPAAEEKRPEARSLNLRETHVLKPSANLNATPVLKPTISAQALAAKPVPPSTSGALPQRNNIQPTVPAPISSPVSQVQTGVSSEAQSVSKGPLTDTHIRRVLVMERSGGRLTAIQMLRELIPGVQIAEVKVEAGEEITDRLNSREPFDLVWTLLEGFDGVRGDQLVKSVKKYNPQTPVILWSNMVNSNGVIASSTSRQLLESLQGQGLIQGFFSKTLPSPTPEQREALRSILENLPRPESRADILKTIVETSVKTSHSETGAMQTMDASSKTLAVNTSDAANLRTDLTTSTFSQTAVTVNDIEELLEQNVGLGGGYLQGFVGVTTDLTENIYSRIVHQFNAQALITSLVFPDAEASESFTFASAPEAFKRVAQFNDARKVLGWKTLTASDALVLGPEFAFDHGAIAVIRTVFGNIPAAVIVRSEKDAQMVDEINAKLIEANRPPILKAKDVQDAKARLKAEAVRLKTATVSALTFKAMVFANEPMMALLKEQLPDTMVVTPERFQNFLNLAGDRIHVLVQEVQSRFVLERAA